MSKKLTGYSQGAQFDKGTGEVESNSFCMPSGYARVVKEMTQEMMYPAWNARADHQPNYPDVKMVARTRDTMASMSKSKKDI